VTSKELKTFKSLRAVAFTHALVYSLLIATWLGPGMDTAKYYLGWAHGTLWIAMTTAMLVALSARLVQWQLVFLVGVLGPIVPFVGALGFLHFKPDGYVKSSTPLQR